MLCVLLGGCIRLHFNCDSEVPAVGTGSTSIMIKPTPQRFCQRIDISVSERLSLLPHQILFEPHQLLLER